MTGPCCVSDLDLESVLLARRFSVEQGVRSDGSPKVRGCDDMSGNGLNPCFRACEKLGNDRLDKLAALVTLFFRTVSSLPALWKADVDSAYRRIPVKPEHRDLLWIVILLGGEILAARHNSLPFGCVASVYQ